MTSENARKFLKWSHKYCWIADYHREIALDLKDYKVCLTNPGQWTYMFKSREDRDWFKRITAQN